MFALGHPEKITDFAYRSMHETVVKAKLITTAFYGKGPKYSYYNGCSTGGRQGLIEITRFPEDFDAASVGAPANPHVHLHAAGVERSLQLMKNNAPLSQAKVKRGREAVVVVRKKEVYLSNDKAERKALEGRAPNVPAFLPPLPPGTYTVSELLPAINPA